MGKKKQQPWGCKLSDKQMAEIGLNFKEKHPDQIDFGYRRMHAGELAVSSHAMQRMHERDNPLFDALKTGHAVVKGDTVVTVLPKRNE